MRQITIFALASALLLSSAQAASACTLTSAADGRLRKKGTAAITISGAISGRGTYPAVCGAYFLQDSSLGRAGDGLVFETCVPGAGLLQLNSSKRIAGTRGEVGLVFNADGGKGSFTAMSTDAGNTVDVGASFFSAKVRASLKKLFKPDRIRIEAVFKCGG